MRADSAGGVFIAACRVNMDAPPERGKDAKTARHSHNAMTGRPAPGKDANHANEFQGIIRQNLCVKPSLHRRVPAPAYP